MTTDGLTSRAHSMKMLRHLIAAAGISAITLSIAIAMQLVHWSWKRTDSHEFLVRTSVQNIVLVNNDSAALVQCSVHPPRDSGNQQIVEVHDLKAKSARRKNPLSHGLPWLIAGSRSASYGFVCSESGGLYWFDAANTLPQFCQLDRHTGAYAELLECSDDGAVVLLAERAEISFWDRAAARKLWTHEDIEVKGCAFLPNTQCVICGLATGDLVELDPATGRIERQIGRGPSAVTCVSISDNGQYVATGDISGNCAVRELDSGRCLWSYHSPVMPVVRFMPDGNSVLVSNPSQGVDASQFSLVTGQPVATLTSLGKWIKQMRVTCQGTAYLCSDDATVTAWDPASGAILNQFKVGAKL